MPCTIHNWPHEKADCPVCVRLERQMYRLQENEPTGKEDKELNPEVEDEEDDTEDEDSSEDDDDDDET